MGKYKSIVKIFMSEGDICPADDWIDHLNKKQKKIIYTLLTKVIEREKRNKKEWELVQKIKKERENNE